MRTSTIRVFAGCSVRPLSATHCLTISRTRAASSAPVDGFKRLIALDERQIARNLVHRFAAHLTGAEIEFADRGTVEEILDSTAAEGYGVRSLLERVVASGLFTRK